MDIAMSFVERLERAVVASGLSRSAVARAAGLKPSALSDAVAGRRRLYFDQVAALARVLECSLDWLAGEGPDVPADRLVKARERAWLALGRSIGFDAGLRASDPDAAERVLLDLRSAYLAAQVAELTRGD